MNILGSYCSFAEMARRVPSAVTVAGPVRDRDSGHRERTLTRRASIAVLLVALLLPAPTLPAGQRDAGIGFDHYHSVDEIEAWLEAVTARHAGLADLVEFGRSREGRPLLAVEINNPDTGPAADKPGFYLDGNIHGGELLGGEAALHFVQTLLEGHGRDARITELVDATAFYVVPVVNPDGRALSVDTPLNHRWNLRPVDEDGDGRVDEDPPDDLDGDGQILRMRVVDPRGRFKAAADDPRRLERRGRGDRDGPFYEVMEEGIDNDSDGSINEDGPGGVDLNRNFPANWSPAQFASGPFPLSEPETWALVDYITARPNIAAVHTYHTAGGLILRFPTLAGQEWDYPESDLEAYRAIAADGAEVTGYANFADEKEPIVELMSPGHGVFNDWASKVLGVFAITTEMWANGFGQGEDARFRWNDQVLGGRGFVDWRPFDHPDLGEVELGGWSRFTVSNPPEEMIEAELVRNTEWVLGFAEKLPRVAIAEADAMPLAGAEGLVTVQASVGNVGFLPTATAHAADELGTTEPVVVEISVEGATLLADVPGRSRAGETRQSQSLGVLRGTGRAGRPKMHHFLWNVELDDPSRPARAEIVVRSQKAGVARRTLELPTGR